MSDLEILEELKIIIERLFGITVEDIEENSALEKDLNIGDLEMDDLISAIEAKYDVKIPQEKISTFKKISDIVNYLYENIDIPQ